MQEYQIQNGTPSVFQTYHGSDGVASRRLYKILDALGATGELASLLSKAQKVSVRAKTYRGRPEHGIRSFSQYSDEKKHKHLNHIAAHLQIKGPELQLNWGWKRDRENKVSPWIRYVDLPNGQISFHAYDRITGPDYAGQWDGTQHSEARIINYAQSVLHRGAGISQ